MPEVRRDWGYSRLMQNGAHDIIERVFGLASEDERAKILVAELQGLYEAGDWSAEALERFAEDRARLLENRP